MKSRVYKEFGTCLICCCKPCQCSKKKDIQPNTNNEGLENERLFIISKENPTKFTEVTKEIRQLLSTAKKEAYSVPMGVSQWRAHGKKYGYWHYFEKQEVDIGKKIKDMRLLCGLSLNEVGGYIKKSESSMSYIESGKRPITTREIKKLVILFSEKEIRKQAQAEICERVEKIPHTFAKDAHGGDLLLRDDVYSVIKAIKK